MRQSPSLPPKRLLEDSLRDREPLFPSAIVLCESLRVLSRSYGQTKPELIHELEQILEIDQFQIEYEALVRRSLQTCRLGRENFSDYLIVISKRHGCRDIVTFDCALKKLQRIYSSSLDTTSLPAGRVLETSSPATPATSPAPGPEEQARRHADPVQRCASPPPLQPCAARDKTARCSPPVLSCLR